MSCSLLTRFRMVKMGSVDRFLYQNLILFASTFWVSLSTLLLTLFAFLRRAFFRFKRIRDSPTNNPSCNSYDSSSMGIGTEAKESPVVTKEDDCLGRTESPNFVFKFKYQTCRDDHEVLAPNLAKKYEFFSGKDLSHYMKVPEVDSLAVKELSADSNDASLDTQQAIKRKFLSDQNSEEQNDDSKSVNEGLAETSVHSSCEREVTLRAKSFDEEEKQNFEAETSSGESVPIDDVGSGDDVQFLSEKDLFELDSDSDSVTSSHEFMSRFLASTSDGFLSDTDYDETSEVNILREKEKEKVEWIDDDLELEYLNLQNSSTGYKADDFDEENSDIMAELHQNPQNYDNSEDEELDINANEPTDILYSSEKSDPQNSSTTDSEDTSRLETLWEHQDLIEQLQMELKKVRATGLPTILEEDESPNIIEDLKPWKIDEKFQHQDRMGELHKFYKSYRERMRKFDILSYQKMYAASFLPSKDPLKSISSQKASTKLLTWVFSQGFLLCKRKKSTSDPMVSFIRELHSDLEVVYVGQMCLSWEILRWQYEKAVELCESDHYWTRRYSEIACEFQQFQVLLQRFIENEPFEDPRVQYYIKHRCVLRNLLQVPAIREDSNKDRNDSRKGKDNGMIKSDMLVQIMEESIQTFWQFVRADKDAHTVTHKGRKATQIEPQDPTAVHLLTEVRASLLKKEKRLKDIVRGGNCILRKLQKHREESCDHAALHLFSLVDLKLVSRVLNMSKITADQLLWCSDKLSRINFDSRKMHVEIEPSCLLFPC